MQPASAQIYNYLLYIKAQRQAAKQVIKEIYKQRKKLSNENRKKNRSLPS